MKYKHKISYQQNYQQIKNKIPQPDFKIMCLILVKFSKVKVQLKVLFRTVAF
jgi:hypothetical protein